MTFRPVSRCMRTVSSTLAPAMAPSLEMSVNRAQRMPMHLHFLANSSARMSVCTVQPCTANMPSLASMPATIFSGNSKHAKAKLSGSVTAMVPMTTRSAPASSRLRISTMRRSPPPLCTRTGKRFLISPMSESMPLAPVKAPERSTMCSHSAPASTHFSAKASGSP